MMKRDVLYAPVSLIMITYNKLSRLILTLETLKTAEYIEETEVIIVNDGSDDGTKEYLENFREQNKNLNIKVIHIDNSGRSVARNAGIMGSTGKLLIFMDDDLLVSKEFITSHINAHKDKENLIVHGRIYSFPVLKFMANPSTGELYNGQMAKANLLTNVLTLDMVKDPKQLKKYMDENGRLSKFEKDIYELYQSTSDCDSYVRWIGTNGGNFSIKRKSLLKIENFDPYMGKSWGCEDLEVGFHAYQAGYEFSYSVEAANYHITHYREEFQEIHNSSIDYFIGKHRHRYIRILKEYFNEKLKDLVEWKAVLDSAEDSL